MTSNVLIGSALYASIFTIYLMMASNVHAETRTGYVEPDQKTLKNAQIEAQRQLRAAESAMQRGDNEIINKTLEQRDSLSSMRTQTPEGTTMGVNIPYQHNPDVMKKLLADTEKGAETINAKEQGREAYGEMLPIVFISFSMPDDVIRNYMREAKTANAFIALRGFYQNDLEKTLKKISDLVNQDESLAGIGIDPTLFTRFNITKVPAFILPLEQIDRCMSLNCGTPEHVKATGEISIKYFLEQTKLFGNDKEKNVAVAALANYEGDK